jgi:catechol 2,3-dioxygenase-like lactoylglutathione lyase family enzyme
MQVNRLDHLVLTVADISRTSEFYERALGMKPVNKNGRWSLHFGVHRDATNPNLWGLFPVDLGLEFQTDLVWVWVWICFLGIGLDLCLFFLTLRFGTNLF